MLEKTGFPVGALAGVIAALVAGVGVAAITSSWADAAPPSCNGEMARFLANPRERTLADIRGPKSKICWDLVQQLDPARRSEDTMDRLDKLVSSGNVSAAWYIAEHLNSLDGGDLEDADRALGEFGRHNALALLEMANNGRISSGTLSRVVVMLPLDLADDGRAMLDALAARRRKILLVNRAELNRQKVLAIRAIAEEQSEIRKHVNAGDFEK